MKQSILNGNPGMPDLFSFSTKNLHTGGDPFQSGDEQIKSVKKLTFGKCLVDMTMITGFPSLAGDL